MSNKRKNRGKKTSSTRRTFNKEQAWLTIKSNIVGNMLTPQNAKGHMALILKAYLPLNALEQGTLDHDGYYMLNFMNTLFYSLCLILDEQGSMAVKAKMQENIQFSFLVTDALVSINERYQRFERYGGSGEQLKQVREMVQTLDQLAETVPVGVVLRAIQAAQTRVDCYLSKQKRAA